MRELISVLVGGALGTGLRLLADTLLPHSGSGLPVSTLLVNVLGSFLLGVLVARFWAAPPWVRAGLGAGLLGSFTTFSAVMVSLVELGAAERWWWAVGYLVVTLVLGFGAAALGLRVGRVATPIDWADE